MHSYYKIICSILFSLFVCACNVTKEIQQQAIAMEESKADILFINGKIYTMSAARNKVQALAVKDGNILFTGTNEAAKEWAGNQTKVIDLKDRMVLPSFNDGHIHPFHAGKRLLNCDLTGLKEEGEILAAIEDYCKKHPDKEWIIGDGLWLPNVGNGNPHKSILDAIEPNRPVYIISTDGHSAWMNSKVFEMANITADTKNPVGGVIERDENGNPSGVLREYAKRLVTNAMPSPSLQDKIKALEMALQKAHQNGITSWVDAGVDEEKIQSYLELEKADKLSMDVTLSLATNPIKELEGVKETIALYEKYQPQSEKINMKSIKILIDGVIEGKTAALFDNYEGEDYRGDIYIKPQAFNEMVAAYDKAGFQLQIHACGDRGISLTFDAYEYARQQNGIRDARHHIDHLQVMAEKDIRRFRELDVIAGVSTLWATPEDTYISDLTIPVLGPERSEWIYPFGAISKSGAMIAAGSDWPVTTVNPFHAIQVAITRRGPDEVEREPWTPQHLMTRYDIISSYTNGGAYLTFSENKRGSLEVGKEANLIVLDRDLFAIPATEIHKTKVLLTILRGKEIYRQDF